MNVAVAARRTPRGGLVRRRPLRGGTEPEITGALLLGFAVGWTLLALLSARFADRLQRQAAVPAAR